MATLILPGNDPDAELVTLFVGDEDENKLELEHEMGVEDGTPGIDGQVAWEDNIPTCLIEIQSVTGHCFHLSNTSNRHLLIFHPVQLRVLIRPSAAIAGPSVFSTASGTGPGWRARSRRWWPAAWSGRIRVRGRPRGYRVPEGCRKRRSIRARSATL